MSLPLSLCVSLCLSLCLSVSLSVSLLSPILFSSSVLLFFRVAALLEKDLELQGITGVEDKLQQDVGTTIEKLRKAGIKVRV